MDPSVNDFETEVNPEEHPFLDKLKKDYPDMAERIKSQIPSWSQEVDTLSGIHGLGKEILKVMDYVSKSEEEIYYSRTAAEIQDILNTNEEDRIMFVSWMEGKSGYYIFNQIKNNIPDDLKNRIEIIPSHALNIESHNKRCKSKSVHYFICDDSSNSGEQLRDLTKPFRLYAEQNPIRKFFDHSKNVILNIRMMRNSDIAVELVDNFEKDISNSHVSVNLKSTRIPQVVDAVLNLGANPEELSQTAQDAIIFDHKDWLGAIGGFFYHKIQDNLPPILIEGRKKIPGVTPLLKRDDIVKPYN